MEKERMITKSSGPWCSPIILVRKKDGTIHLCVDYRKLNDVTLKEAYPLPRIDDILDALRGAKYFYNIDFASSYRQIKVAEKDREKTPWGWHVFENTICWPRLENVNSLRQELLSYDNFCLRRALPQTLKR